MDRRKFLLTTSGAVAGGPVRARAVGSGTVAGAGGPGGALTASRWAGLSGEQFLLHTGRMKWMLRVSLLVWRGPVMVWPIRY